MIVPIFLPHLGCARRCIYCNQDHITDSGSAGLPERVDRLFAGVKGPVEAAFYGGNMLGLSAPELDATLGVLGPYRDRIDRVRISAKPGPVGPDVISVLRAHGVRTVELGVPTFNDDILTALGRGHTADDLRRTYRCLAGQGFETGLQVMVGLPGETWADVAATAEGIVRLSPAFVRIYPLVVIEDTRLCSDFRNGRFSPDPLETAVAKAAFIYTSAWTKGIRTIKMGLTANDVLPGKIAAGPFHPAFGYLVKSEAFLLALLRVCRDSGASGRVVIYGNTGDAAHLTGHRRANIARLAAAGINPAWAQGEGIEEGRFIIESGGRKVGGSLADGLYSLFKPETPS